ncbi:DUF397 domain-containing protein [Streptomyces albireticuli]|uniref:DUF397 domain-containing protein n=1 Tax=Streptomyces albireticuli TaxID=1940 RepID=UPI003686D622
MGIALDWQKSSFSSSGAECVEVARHSGGAYFRESDEPDVALAISRAELKAFLCGIKTEAFDRQPALCGTTG